MDRLTAHLNPEQLAAVTLPHEHALILAGAGSGKTRVLTTRIAWLIQNGLVSPAGVLAVTFTNKAAREMLARLSAMMPLNPRGMWIGTFHGLCNRLLRAHHRDAALPQTFQILDSADQLAAIKRLMKSLNIDDQRHPPRQVQQFINSAKEEGLRARDIEIVDDFNRRHVELYAAYDDQCQREGVVDFAELLLRSHELLERNLPLRQHYQARFSHILIDEFQDTNTLQYKWLKLLAGPRSAVFAVGDDDQSIYRFRGANIGNMAAFEREFGVKNLVKLEQNYRSHGHILDCANTLIRNNTTRLGKELWTQAGEGEPVRIHEALSDTLEAQWLLEEIKGLINEGWARSDIALLYRSNAQSRVLEHALFSAGIPYRVYGGLRFFERAEVKHALAYLRLMENAADDTSFLRVVNFPARGIGARSIEQLQDAARVAGSSLFDATATLSGAAGTKLQAFAQLIARLRQETAMLPLPEVVEHVVERSGLILHYQSEREGQERIENLRELVNAAAAFLAEQGVDTQMPANVGLADDVIAMSPLAAFLSHASLEAGDNQAQEGTDALQLMTVHSAKGLEFDGVFITGLEEGLFPHENSIQEQDGLEEERRLMYVAITRARKRLYLSLSQTRMLHGQTRYNLRSRFLEELPEEHLKWLTPRAGLARNDWGAAAQGGWGGAGWGGGARGSGYGGALGDRGSSRSSSGGYPGGGYSGGASGGRALEAPSYSSPADQRAAARFDRGLPWRPGQTVAHARFGEGVILAIEGSGNDARVQINFGRQGVKWLALSVAKLDPVT